MNLIRKHYDADMGTGGGNPSPATTNYVHVEPNSHFWTNIEMLIHWVQSMQNIKPLNIPSELVEGLKNCLKHGYDIRLSPAHQTSDSIPAQDVKEAAKSYVNKIHKKEINEPWGIEDVAEYDAFLAGSAYKSDAVDVEWSEDFSSWLIDNEWEKYPDGWTHKGGANGWYCNFAQAYQMFMSANKDTK